MNRSIGLGCLMGSLLISSFSAHAESDLKKVGRTVGHAAGNVGHGASKVYHEAAKGTHKVIAKNAKNKHTKAYHMNRAANHKHDSHVQSKLSRKKRRRTVKAAKKL